MIDPRFTNAIEVVYGQLVEVDRAARIILESMDKATWGTESLLGARLDFEEAASNIAVALDYTGTILTREGRIP